jgi:two-component system response regulator
MDRPILLVEDNPDDEALTLRALAISRVGNRVVVARDGAEALAYLLGTPEAPALGQLPALVLLDLKLPKVDGLGVLQQLRAAPRTRRLPVVILTSSGEDRDLVGAYELGANSYVRKPVDFVEFVEAVQQLGLFWLVVNQPAPEPDGKSVT